MPRLAGKVAFITGAGTGIGRATAILFAREGARVAIAEIDAAAGEETAHLAGGDAIAIRTDVTDEASMQAAVRTTVQHFGALHVLHNNAGGSTPQDNTVVDAPIEEFWRVIRLDLFGTFLGCRCRHPGDHQVRRRLGHQHVVERRADGHRRARLLHRGEGRRCGDHPLDGGGIRAAARARERHRAVGDDDRTGAQAGGGQCRARQAGGRASAGPDRAAGHRQHGAVPGVRRIPHGHRTGLSGGQRRDDFLRRETMKIKRVEHIAIAVNSLKQSMDLMQNTFGIPLEYEEQIGATRLAMLPVGETYIELLESKAPDSGVNKWIAEKGEGLFHICFEVEDIDGALAELKAKGVKLRDETPRIGHGGARIAFLDPASTGNVLIELAELAGHGAHA